MEKWWILLSLFESIGESAVLGPCAFDPTLLLFDCAAVLGYGEISTSARYTEISKRNGKTVKSRSVTL